MNTFNCHFNAKLSKHVGEALSSLSRHNDHSLFFNAKPVLNSSSESFLIDCRDTTEVACGWHSGKSKITYCMPKLSTRNKVDELKDSETVFSSCESIIFRHVIVTDSVRYSNLGQSQMLPSNYKRMRRRNTKSPDRTKEFTYLILRRIFDNELFQYIILNSVYRNLKLSHSPVEFYVSQKALLQSKSIINEEKDNILDIISDCPNGDINEPHTMFEHNLSKPESRETPLNKTNPEYDFQESGSKELSEPLKLPPISDFSTKGMPVDINRLTDRMQHWEDELKRDKKTKSDLKNKQMPKRFNECDYSESSFVLSTEKKSEKNKLFRKLSNASLFNKLSTDMFVPASKILADRKVDKFDHCGQSAPRQSVSNLKSFSTSDLQQIAKPAVKKKEPRQSYLPQDYIWSSSAFKNLSGEAAALINDPVDRMGIISLNPNLINSFHANSLGKNKARDKQNVPSIPDIAKQRVVSAADLLNSEAETLLPKGPELRLQGSKV